MTQQGRIFIRSLWTVIGPTQRLSTTGLEFHARNVNWRDDILLGRNGVTNTRHKRIGKMLHKSDCGTSYTPHGRFFFAEASMRHPRQIEYEQKSKPSYGTLHPRFCIQQNCSVRFTRFPVSVFVLFTGHSPPQERERCPVTCDKKKSCDGQPIPPEFPTPVFGTPLATSSEISCLRLERVRTLEFTSDSWKRRDCDEGSRSIFVFQSRASRQA